MVLRVPSNVIEGVPHLGRRLCRVKEGKAVYSPHGSFVVRKLGVASCNSGTKEVGFPFRCSLFMFQTDLCRRLNLLAAFGYCPCRYAELRSARACRKTCCTLQRGQ